MASVNTVMLLGHIGKDPVARTQGDGQSIATCSLATNERRISKGETKVHTEWHNLVFPPFLAQDAVANLRSGDCLYVEGSLATRQWVDRRTQQKRYATHIKVARFSLNNPSEASHGN